MEMKEGTYRHHGCLLDERAETTPINSNQTKNKEHMSFRAGSNGDIVRHQNDIKAS